MLRSGVAAADAIALEGTQLLQTKDLQRWVARANDADIGPYRSPGRLPRGWRVSRFALACPGQCRLTDENGAHIEGRRALNAPGYLPRTSERAAAAPPPTPDGRRRRGRRAAPRPGPGGDRRPRGRGAASTDATANAAASRRAGPRQGARSSAPSPAIAGWSWPGSSRGPGRAPDGRDPVSGVSDSWIGTAITGKSSTHVTVIWSAKFRMKCRAKIAKMLGELRVTK